MMMLLWTLLLSAVALGSKLDVYFDQFKSCKMFLKHNDLYVPLAPVLWGQLMGQQKMIIAMIHRDSDPVDLQTSLSKLSVDKFVMVDRRGLLRYDDELVTEISQEPLPEADRDLGAAYERISRVLGSVDGFAKAPFGQLVLLNGVLSKDVKLIPSVYWKKLSREQFGEVALKGSLAMMLDRLHELKLDVLAKDLLFRHGRIMEGSLVALKTAAGVETPLFQIPGAIKLSELTPELMKVYGEDVINGLGFIELFAELDPKGTRVLAEVYGGILPEEKLDRKTLETAWKRIFKSVPLFKQSLPTSLRMRSSLIPAISNPESTGKERLEKFMLEACEIPFDNVSAGDTLGNLAKKYLNRLREIDGDLAALEFMAKVQSQGIDSKDVAWKIDSWKSKHWNAVSRLPPKTEYLELIVVGFLLGEVEEVPSIAPGIPRTHEWRQFTSKRTLAEKLERKFLRENIEKLARGLLWVVNSDPLNVKLPDSLLQAVQESSGVEASIKTALWVHAYRQDGRKLKCAAGPLKSIHHASIYNTLDLSKLKLFLSAGHPDAMNVLLPNSERLLTFAKSDQGELPSKVLLEICDLVLSDMFDPDDMQLLVTLLEINWKRVDVEVLKRVQRKLLQIDATSVNRTPDSDSMHRMALIVRNKEPANLSEKELTLEELLESFPHQFPGAKFAVPSVLPSTDIKWISAHEVIDSLVWQTAGHAIPCAAAIQMISYVYAERNWSDELMKSVGWVLGQLDDAQLLNLLGRVQQEQVQLVNEIVTQATKLGFTVDRSAEFGLAPLRALLDSQENQAGLQQLLIEYERTIYAKSACFILDPQPILERFFQLGSVELGALRQKWTQAYGLAGTFEYAFKLLKLAESFENLPMIILWEILQDHKGSIAAAATAIKDTITDP